jgi:hypothetical protein
LKKRIFADAIPSSAGFHAVRQTLREPAPNTRRVHPGERGGLRNGQEFGLILANRAKYSSRNPYNSLAFKDGYFDSSPHRKKLALVKKKV